MIDRFITSDDIFERTRKMVAPLPCQEEYLRQLASILSFHIHRNHLIDEGYLTDDLPPMSAIVVAPTGQGKTFLLRKMAEAAELNLITIDCSTLAAEGWKGVSLSQRLLTAQRETKDPKAFERSIMFLDEVDKLRLWGTNSDQGNPMNNILQLYNSGCVTAEGCSRESVNIDIKRFTVLLGGAFEGVEKIIKERQTPQSRIGFGREEKKKLSKAERFKQVTKEDLVAYGMLPELVGRIGTILTIEPLTLEDYRQLLRGENGSIQCQYRNYLRGLYGVSVDITDAAADNIAQACTDSSGGTRAATPIINELMRGALSAVEQDATINAVILDTKGEDLFVRYEHGARGYCFSDDTEAELPTHRLKGKNIVGLADKLCRYYRKAEGDLTVLPVLQAFLECTFEYLAANAIDEEFCFSSLEKLARTVQHEGQSSKFELLMGGCGIKSYDRFCALYTPSTQRDLVIALQQIMDYLESYYGRAHIQFAVKNKTNKQGGK